MLPVSVYVILINANHISYKTVRSDCDDGGFQPSSGLSHDLEVHLPLRRRPLLAGPTGNASSSQSLQESSGRNGTLSYAIYHF